MKITVIGAGNVGATCANVIAEKELAEEVILIDIKEGIAEGKSLDMWQTAPINVFDSRVKGYTNNYESCVWEECEDRVEDNSDKIWTELFELLTAGNYELKSMNPIQWKIFEKSAIFETTEHYHDYYESGTRYITYLSLPDIFKFVK